MPTLQVGRTVGKYFKFVIKDSSGTLRDIPVDTIGGVGITYPEVDVSALQDVLKGFLLGQGTVALTIGGPFDTSAVQAASASGALAALSGSHTVLSGVVGLTTPLSFAVYIGVREYWTAAQDIVFGLTSSATSGVIVTDYQVDVVGGKYTAKIAMYPGSSAPSFGTAAIT
jgi:hypothetical protein